MSIISYQLGDVHKAIVYKQYYGSVGMHAELKIAMADLTAQIHMLCLKTGLDFSEVENLGLRRLAEFTSKRMKR